jgi:hypothetical protein
LFDFIRGGKMLVLAMAAFAASTIAMQPADTAKPIRVALVCAKSSQKTSGLTKICYYDCGGSEGAVTVKTYEACPRRKLRWQLNRTGPFGPSGISR